MIERMVVQSGAPSATPDSRSALDCSRSTSSVVRVTTGAAIRARASAPAKPEKPLRGRHHHLVDEQADQDGRRRQQHVVQEADDLAVAAVARRTPPARCRPARRRRRRSTMAMAHIMSEPTMALARPPSEPGAGRRLGEDVQVQPAEAVDQQRPAGWRPARRAASTVASQAEGHEDDVASGCGGRGGRASWPSLRCACAPSSSARERQHGEGDQEQHQAQRDQRGRVQLASVASANSLAMVEAMVEPLVEQRLSGSRGNCR